MLESLLIQAGFDVQLAAQGHQGMEIAQDRRFDLILLSANLPDINGFEICAELKQRHISRRTPIVFLSHRCGGFY